MGYIPHDESDSRLQKELENKISECEKLFNDALKQKKLLDKNGNRIPMDVFETMVDALWEMVECYRKMDSYALDFNKEKAQKANVYLDKYTSLLDGIKEREEENER